MLQETLLPVIFVPMTGKAEESRQVKPDPKNPTIQNGDFERVIGDPPQAAAWHYQRQMEVVTADDAPSGKRYVRFHNAESGRGAQALQGFAVDGRYVSQLQFSLCFRSRDVKPDARMQHPPLLEIQFYDENRVTISDQRFGFVHGTSEWRTESKTIDVPIRAREAIIRVGLFGATGELLLDDVRMKGLPFGERWSPEAVR